MLKFHKFSIRNAGCIEYADLDLEDQGLVLVRGENLDEGGSNGAGKTTLFDLLSTTLTGSSGKGARKNDYLPLTGGGNLELLLDFAHNGNEYNVKQYRKHKEHGTRIEILENGLDITPTTKIDDVQKFVLQKSGLTEREWYGSVYLTQQHSHALVSGTPKEKKEYLAAHFGLNEVDACIKVNEKWVNGIVLPDENALRELLTSCDEQIAALPDPAQSTVRKSELSGEAAILSKRLVDVGVELRELESARLVEQQRQQHLHALGPYGYTFDTTTREAVESLRTRIQHAQKAAQTLAARQQLEMRLAALPDVGAPDALQAEIQSGQAELSRLQDLGTKLTQRATLEAESARTPKPERTVDDATMRIGIFRKKLGESEATATMLAAELAKLQKLGDQCPTCLRPVPPEEKAAWIEERRATLDSAHGMLPTLRDSVKALEADLAALQVHDRVDKALVGLPTGDVQATRDEYTNLRNRLTILTQSLTTATSRKSLIEQRDGLHVHEGVEDIDRVPALQAELAVVNAAYEFGLRHGTVRFSEEALSLATSVRQNAQEAYDRVNAEIGQITADEQARTRLLKQKDDIEGKLLRHSHEKQRRRVLEVLQVVLKDVKAKALRDCTEMLRSALPLYVKQLFPQGDVAVELAEEEDSLDFYLRKGSAQIPMSLVSGGQAKRVGLAVLFAFAKLGAKETNILIADEPYKDLDVIGRACAFELFSDLGIPSIFVTSHDQDQLQVKRYHKTLVMRMQGGKSRLYEG